MNDLHDRLDVLDARQIKRHNTHPWLGRHPDPARRSFMRRPDEGEWLFTSPEAMCMTHLTRLVVAHGERLSADALCGTTQSYAVFVDPTDEAFICRRCYVAAERWGRTTFGLVPDTGCSITGGRRGRKVLSGDDPTYKEWSNE